MKKMYKNINIALIFTLIGIFLCQNLAYGLRVPLSGSNERRGEANRKVASREEPITASSSAANTSDSAAMKFQYSGDVNNSSFEKLITEALAGYFYHFVNIRRDAVKKTPVFAAVEPENQQDIVNRIVEKLIGSRKTRLGAAPSDENKLVIRQRVQQSVEKNIPIEVMMTWAPKKHYVVGEDNTVDINELVALERLYDIHKQVEAIYSPGVHYTLYLEDFVGNIIEGYGDDVQKTMRRYMSTMERLVKVLGIDDVLRIVRITRLAPNKDVLVQWYNEADKHYPKLLAYWIESEKKGIEGYQEYHSYKELTKLGWVGPIPQSVRDYYKTRILRLYPGISEEGIRDNILREFSAIIVLTQHKVFQEKSEVLPLKFSFVPAPVGVERERMRGRIDLRPVSVDVTKYSMPPWTGQGYLSVKDRKIRPLMRSWTSLIDPSLSKVKGSLMLGRYNMWVEIRADLLFDKIVDFDPVSSTVGLSAFLLDRSLPTSNTTRDNL